jgi:hypothetical protein
MFSDLRFAPGYAFAIVIVVVGACDFSKGRRELASLSLCRRFAAKEFVKSALSGKERTISINRRVLVVGCGGVTA